MQNASWVLNEAINLLQKSGWAQGGYINNGRICATMALILAAKNMREESYVRACNYVRKVTGADQLPWWNDCIAQSVEDVIIAFKQAADLAKEKDD